MTITYDGINGGGNAPPGRPPGTGGLPPPGRFGMAGAALDVAGGGGGPRFVPYKIDFFCFSIFFD